MKTIYKIILISPFLLISCKNKVYDTDVIDVSNAFDEKVKKNLSTISDKIEYIQLQSDSVPLLGHIRLPKKQVQFSNNRVLVSDSKGALLSFDNSGRFLNKIGDIGRGANEYIKPDQFTFLNGKNTPQIAVFSAAQQKALMYSFDGGHVKDIHVDFWPSDLIGGSEGLVFANSFGSRKYSDYFNFQALDIHGKVVKQFFYKENEKEIEKTKSLGLISMSNLYKLKDTLSYWESGYDTIYRITENYKVIPRFVINIGNNVMPIEHQTTENVSNFKELIKYDRIENVQESERFIFLNVLFNKKKYYIYYDKITKENLAVGFIRPVGKKQIRSSFYNDIDGGIPFWPMGKVSDNKVFMLVYGYQMKDYIERKGHNYEANNLGSRNKLLKLLENVDENDNPILMIVTLKQ